ncbi:hypothetical protein DICVIV_12884 [Dictyocaulus viviparus]|uniref:Uncharacterized protein n=1 Tax=Dictyocaulus viviparus TaxID=29172 RepID=A0A0D8X973_DICVI|nr:hypothetical protein DICVIV_12884 [Dictyocaulus viviparus]
MTTQNSYKLIISYNLYERHATEGILVQPVYSLSINSFWVKLLMEVSPFLEKLLQDLDLKSTTVPTTTTTMTIPTISIESTTISENLLANKTSITIGSTSSMDTTTTNEITTTNTDGAFVNDVQAASSEKNLEIEIESAAQHSSTTTTESSNSSTTTTKTENTQYLLPEARLAKVITPIAGIIDDISPIIGPLLRSQVAVAKVHFLHIDNCFELFYNDINLMEHSDSENSIIGYGTQLAREILNPGSLKRDREIQSRPTHQVLQPKPFAESQVAQPRITYPQAFTRVASVPLAEQAARAARNFRTQSKVRQFELNQSIASKYFALPPPGYKEHPSTLPPLPPSSIPRHKSLSSLPYYPMESHKETLPVINSDSFSIIDSSVQSTTNTPLYTKTPQVSLVANEFIKQIPYSPPFKAKVKVAKQANRDSTGYQKGRSEVKSSFYEDSGVIMGDVEAPSQNLDGSSYTFKPSSGFGGGGFGGGRQPMVSFDESALSGNEQFSFFRTDTK